MNAATPSWSLPHSCDSTLNWIVDVLARSGLKPLRTFDLQDARLGDSHCPCPRHGLEACDCQMVVILVYGAQARPATLILHGSGGQTWLTLVDTPSQQAEAALRREIELALQDQSPPEGL